MGCVLSEEEVKQTQSWLNTAEFIDTSYAKPVIENLIATIHDRDNTIAKLQQKNTLMLETLEAYALHPDAIQARNTIAKVKAGATNDQPGT